MVGTTGQPAAADVESSDSTIVALARAVERALRRLDVLDKNVAQLAADVTALTSHLGQAGGDAEKADGVVEVPAVRSWLLATDADQAAADLAELVEWVGRVYLRFPHAQLSSCWLWHPAAIEELWWLRCAHADAYHPKNGSWLRVGDWHDRQRPGVERRLNKLLVSCGLSRHVERNGRQAVVVEPGEPALGRHHAAVAASWTGTHTAGPTPHRGPDPRSRTPRTQPPRPPMNTHQTDNHHTRKRSPTQLTTTRSPLSSTTRPAEPSNTTTKIQKPYTPRHPEPKVIFAGPGGPARWNHSRSTAAE